MKKKLLIISVALSIVLVIACPYIINNVTLLNFSDQLTSIPLPPNSILMEKRARCGKLTGNGDGMDFLSVILIQSTNDSDELQEYYSTINCKGARFTQKHDLDIIVQQASPELLVEGDILNNAIDFESLKDINDYSDLYFVILFDSGYFHFFDIRGV